MTTPFADIISSIQSAGENGRYTAHISEDWTQGRTTFGGLISAIGTAALRQEIGRDRPLRSLQTAFIGPAGMGDIDIECIHLRTGRSATWAEARISQDGKLCTTLTACFADGRESSITIPAAPMPETKSPEESMLLPFIPGLTPTFTQHYDMAIAIGQPPASQSKTSELGAWIRFKKQDPVGESEIIAFMDLLPPAVIQMTNTFKPVSSLTWHLEMLDDLSQPDTKDHEGWWFFHADAQATANGYSQQHATLYTPAGRAIAMSQQVITIFV